MTALERLALIVADLPDSAVVPVPVSWVRELVAGVSAEPEPANARDCTVADLAERFGRSPSTVRAWLEVGRFPGAYKLRGRDWRVPAAAVAAFLEAQQAGATAPDTAGGDVDLGAWRKGQAA